jgi:hypothetical protein
VITDGGDNSIGEILPAKSFFAVGARLPSPEKYMRLGSYIVKKRWANK